jgi:hypothetical protein
MNLAVIESELEISVRLVIRHYAGGVVPSKPCETAIRASFFHTTRQEGVVIALVDLKPRIS